MSAASRLRTRARSIASSTVRWPRSGSSSAARPQGRLDQQQVGIARELDDRVARTGVAGVDETRAIGRLDRDRPRPGRSAGCARSGRVSGPIRARSSESYSAMSKARRRTPAAPRSRSARASIRSRPPGGRWTGRRVAAVARPRVEVAQSGEVEVVVGMHVADDDGGERPRIEQALEAAGDTLAGVEEDRGVAPRRRGSRRRASRVGDGCAAPEHGQAEAAGQDVGHRGRW